MQYVAWGIIALAVLAFLVSLWFFGGLSMIMGIFAVVALPMTLIFWAVYQLGDKPYNHIVMIGLVLGSLAVLVNATPACIIHWRDYKRNGDNRWFSETGD